MLRLSSSQFDPTRQYDGARLRRKHHRVYVSTPVKGKGKHPSGLETAISLWENEAAMRAYESSDILQKTILPQLKPFFSGDYTTTRCEVRFAEEFD
jgi:hypothetical protein